MSPSSSHDRQLAAWLLVLCALVFSMVVLGGVTRLTHSGLSIVEWKPVTGVLPPLSDAQWRDAFAKYRQFPEYEKMNLDMTLPGFKSIFWLEYLHRLLGRAIGLLFVVPFLYFWSRGRIRPGMGPKLALMFVLGGLQGLLGWYMVKSGLVDRPDVSQYRLTAHLGAAVLIYGYMLWVALGLLASDGAAADAGARRLRRLILAGVVLVCVTLLSGGFVAGLDAGFAYNTFPLMGGRLVPGGLFALEPAYVNFFENIVTVQFSHRVLAIVVLVFVGYVWLRARREPLSPGTRLAFSCLLAAVLLQVALGIATLLLRVPVALAATHQAGALILFTTALWALHRVRKRALP